MAFIKFDLVPSVNKDDSALAAGQMRVVSTDKVRWYQADANSLPRLETIGGWELYINSPVTGICRGICAYTDTVPNTIVGIGTHTNLYAIYSGTLYDITPIRQISQLGSTPFATVNLSATVTVTHTSHGATAGDTVTYSGAAAVNGITLSGNYIIQAVIDANTYTVTASNVANATGSGGSAVVIATYQISVGLADSLSGLGYGVGGYSSGGYSLPSSSSYFKARTWDLWGFGKYLLAHPSGGSLYEFRPNFSVGSYVTNGAFSADANWTKGTGWTISGGTANAATSAAGQTLSQAVSVVAGNLYTLQFQVTSLGAGSFQASVGGSNIGAVISATGIYTTQFIAAATGSLMFTVVTTLTASLTNISITDSNFAFPVTNAPTSSIGMFVTPENFVVLLGTTNAVGAYSAMTVRWSDQAVETVWAPLATNQARDTALQGGTKLVAGRPVRGQSLIWSDTSVFTMTYTGDPSFVYAFAMVGANCGLIGPNAVAVIDGSAFWMTPNGRIVAYAGGGVQTVACPLIEDTFNNLASGQNEKIFASVVNYPGGTAIKWEIPDGRDGIECSRYIEFQPSNGTWSSGTMARTAAVGAGVTPYPLAVDTSGNVSFQEKGHSANGAAISWSFKTAPAQVGNGDTLLCITRMVGDWQVLTGACQMSLYGKIWPNDAETVTGPYTITSSDQHTDFVVTARQVAIGFYGSGSPAQMRIGEVRFDIMDTGMTI